MAELDEISRVQGRFRPLFLIYYQKTNSRVHLPYSADWLVDCACSSKMTFVLVMLRSISGVDPENFGEEGPTKPLVVPVV